MKEYWTHGLLPMLRRVCLFASGGIVMALLLIPAVIHAGGYDPSPAEMRHILWLCVGTSLAFGLIFEGLYNVLRGVRDWGRDSE